MDLAVDHFGKNEYFKAMIIFIGNTGRQRAVVLRRYIFLGQQVFLQGAEVVEKVLIIGIAIVTAFVVHLLLFTYGCSLRLKLFAQIMKT